MKSRLQARLQELEPIPELLKSTELKLQDASEQLLAYERKNTENTKLIAELSSKVCMLTSILSSLFLGFSNLTFVVVCVSRHLSVWLFSVCTLHL